MTAGILDGKATARRIKSELAERVAALKRSGVTPGLATVLVGDDPGSTSYVNGKHKDCAEVGIASIRRHFPDDVDEATVLQTVDELNHDAECTGYIVQLPLPKQIDPDAVLHAIDPAKDADGLHPTNLGSLMLNVNSPVKTPLPCTPRAIIALLQRYGIDLPGQHVVVVGRGVTVGRSIGSLLTRREYNATVTLTHTGTRDLDAHLRSADIVVAAAGSAGIVHAGNIRPGAIVLDVGVSRSTDPETGKSKIVGDAADDVADVASWRSPNPGGVGPMTRALLLENVVDAAERRLG